MTTEPSSLTPDYSATQTSHVVLPGDTNNHGTLFGGTLVSWMDIAAAITARKHSAAQVVTASINEMHFLEPVRVGDIVTIYCKCNYTRRSFMEIGMRVVASDGARGEPRQVARTYFTFCAIGADGTMVSIPTIQPESDEDRKRFAAAEQRFEAQRKERAARKARLAGK